MIVTKSYVRVDQAGPWRVGCSRVSLDSVVYAYLQGHSPESIQDQYPALTLEEVHGAIAFFLANREEVEQYLKAQEKNWNELKTELEKSLPPVVARLRSQRNT